MARKRDHSEAILPAASSTPLTKTLGILLLLVKQVASGKKEFSIPASKSFHQSPGVHLSTKSCGENILPPSGPGRMDALRALQCLHGAAQMQARLLLGESPNWVESDQRFALGVEKGPELL